MATYQLNGGTPVGAANYKIRGVVFLEAGNLVAQCLEHDIAVQATSMKGLYYELERTIVGRVVIGSELGVDPFASVPSAPKEYWEKFESAFHIEIDQTPFRVPKDIPIPCLELRAA